MESEFLTMAFFFAVIPTIAGVLSIVATRNR
jgi:hypothetical protein